MIILMPSKLFPLLTTSCFLQTHPGSMDISWGIVATSSLEGCTHRLSMYAVMHVIKL